MEYVYSALILHSAGQDITESAVTKVLSAAGVTVDAARVKALTASLEGVNIKEAIEKAAAAPVAAAAPGGASAKAPEKEETKEPEVSEEEAAAGLGALFG